jgi:type IV pilus assembly protein PilQ
MNSTVQRQTIPTSAAWAGLSGVRLFVAALFFLQSLDLSAVPAPQGPAVRKDTTAVSRLQKISFDEGRVRLQLDKETAFRVFSLSQPPRVVIELPGTLFSEDPYEAQVDHEILTRIRSAQFKRHPEPVARVVLDVARLASYEAVPKGSAIELVFKDFDSAARPAGRSAPARDKAAALGESPKASAGGANRVDAGPAHKGSGLPTLAGEAEAAVTASAEASVAPVRPKQRRSRDLLASLPKHSVTLDFDNADIRDVLRVLSEMSGINIIHSPDVTGLISIHLDKVPFNQAFDTILSMNGLVAQQLGDNILRVLTPAALSVDRSRAVTVYKTFTLNYAKAGEIQSHLASLRISPNGKITVDDRTNSLVVTDTPEGLAAVERLIAELDEKPQQVMIEAKIVEITLTNSLDLGIQWEYANRNTEGNTTYQMGKRFREESEKDIAGHYPFPEAVLDPTTGEPTTFQRFAGLPSERGTGVNLPGQSQASSAISFGLINNSDIFSATLNALSTKGQLKVLSSPKVITVNNRLARIQVGSRVPFSTVSVAPSGVVTQAVTYIDVGVILTVTPTISADSRVRLNVKPEVSIPLVSGVVGAAPTINTRNAETEVLIRDGDTLVVGGLIDDQTTEAASKVPLLGDIPVLGTFFRRSNNEKRRTELLVFLTPRIIRD